MYQHHKMKTLINLILLLFLIYIGNAQNNLYEIEYVYIANKETAVRGIDKLYFDTSSKKAFYKNGKVEIISEKRESEEDSIIIDVFIENKNPEFIYIDFQNNLLYNQSTPLQKTYLIRESIPILNWQITQDTKTVNNIELTKASTSFRGRNYEAWFSYEHPIAIGPWKFNGLPGLIFEVNELAETNNYSWKLKTLKNKKDGLSFNHSLTKNLIDIKDYRNKLAKEFIELDNTISLKIDFDLPASSKEELEVELEKFLENQIEKKYEWED